MAKKMKPVHPGEILHEEFMLPLRLSMNRMATDLRVPVTRIADIVNERRGITADTALRFARYFKNAPAFWMNLQTATTWKSPRTKSPPKSPAMYAHWNQSAQLSKRDTIESPTFCDGQKRQRPYASSPVSCLNCQSVNSVPQSTAAIFGAFLPYP